MSTGDESQYEKDEAQGYSGTAKPDEEDTVTGQFTPHLTTIKPATGAEGDVITLVGDDLSAVSGVRLGDADADFEVVGDHELRATVPAGEGTVDVTVQTPDGSTDLGDAFTYTADDS